MAISLISSTLAWGQVSGPSVSTASVMSALPVGTVLLFDKIVPNPAPLGWEPCGYSGFVRIDQTAPGSSYPGQSASISGTTSAPVNDRGYHQGDTGTNPPEAEGVNHAHNFSAQLTAGTYFPPAQNFACLHKVQ
jgi:hypothetical protein